MPAKDRNAPAPWQITVVKKGAILAKVMVPAHRLGNAALAEFLRALVARHRTETAEEMLAYYINRRSGSPQRLPFVEVVNAWAPDQSAHGYLCGDGECCAFAMQATAPETAAAVRKILEQTRAASLGDDPA